MTDGVLCVVDVQHVFADPDSPWSAPRFAQVHPAILPTGEAVVVKVLRPGIDVLVQTDLAAVRLAARLLKFSKTIRRRTSRSASTMPHQAATGTPRVIRKPWNWTKKSPSARKTTQMVPSTMSTPSMLAAIGRGIRTPAESRARPEL